MSPIGDIVYPGSQKRAAVTLFKMLPIGDKLGEIYPKFRSLYDPPP